MSSIVTLCSSAGFGAWEAFDVVEPLCSGAHYSNMQLYLSLLCWIMACENRCIERGCSNILFVLDAQHSFPWR
jgi:hypothetical protein